MDCSDRPPKIDFLDEEQRRRVRDCLQMAKRKLSEAQFEQLVSRIARSIVDFQSQEPRGSYRAAHNALKNVRILVYENDPPYGQIRLGISTLPNLALEYLTDRAELVMSDLSPADRFKGDLKSWASQASGEKLVEILKYVIDSGMTVVPGRSRGAGTRSRSRLEPRIMGKVRGANDELRPEGRPHERERFQLVGSLCHDWSYITGNCPRPGRSDHSGFGDLVHSVFQWCGLSIEQGTYSLRHYWEAISQPETQESNGEFNGLDDKVGGHLMA